MANPYEQFVQPVSTNPYAQFAQQPAQEPVSVGYDMGKSFASGIVKGGIGLAALPGTVEQLGRIGVNYVGRQFGAEGNTVAPEAALPQFSDIKGTVERNVTGPLYEPQTTAGQYAGTIAEFLPGMLFPAGGVGAHLGRRAAMNVIAPAVTSETAGQLTKGSAAEPYARAGGAIAGSIAPQIIGRMISPGAINTSTAKGAERARDVAVMRQEGVPLSAGDVSGNRSIRWAESVAADTPLAAGRAAALKDTQSERFVEATLRRAGINARAATPEVMNDAFDRLGNEFNRAANRIAVPLSITPVGRQLTQDVSRIAANYERITEPSLRSSLPRAINDDLAQLARQNQYMSGDVYNVWRSQLGAAARGAQDPRTRDALYSIQNTLDDAAETWLRSAGRGDVATSLKNARREYRNLLAIERAAIGAGENAALGTFSPQQLAQAVKTVHGQRNYARGQGDLVDLARGGAALMAPLPNSGTPARLVMSAMGGAAGAALGGAPGAAAGVVAPIIGQAVASRAVLNPTMQRYLGNQVASPMVSMAPGNREAARINAAAQFNETQSERDRLARALQQR